MKNKMNISRIILYIAKIYFKFPLWIRAKTDVKAKKIYFKLMPPISHTPALKKKFTGSEWVRDIKPFLSPTYNYDFTVILPSLRSGTLSAGPAIAIQIAYSLAKSGRSVRVASIDGFMGSYDVSEPQIFKMLQDTLNAESLPSSLSFEVLHNLIQVNVGEFFLATAWQTQQLALEAQSLSGNLLPPFYLIQDYEPLLHNSSSESVLSEQTYSQPHIPIVASHILADYFRENEIGLTSIKLKEIDDHFILPLPKVERASKLRSSAYQFSEENHKKKTLLFYARPEIASRNLFELGVIAIQKSIEIGILDPSEWNFLGIGSKFEPIELSEDAILTNPPWLNYEQYLNLIENSDLYIALMNSPHTGFPVIEAVQLGVPTVTTTFATKNIDRFAKLSNGIFASEPKISDLVSSISEAISFTDPITFDPDFFKDLEKSYQGLIEWMNAKIGVKNDYKIELMDKEICKICTTATPNVSHKESLTIGMSIFNIDRTLLIECLQSVAKATSEFQDCVEVIILDNGSAVYQDGELNNLILKYLPGSIFIRQDRNNGIANGMKILLDHSSSSYFVPIDADDLLAENSIRIILNHILNEPEVDFFYSNEWLLSGTSAYAALRYNFDPVLLSEICFTTHLNIFRTSIAKELDVYSTAPNGSHDWFTAVQFLKINSKFQHINHFLYYWRMHQGSTSENWTSKPYVKSSQWQVLQSFADSVHSEDFEIREHPNFFGGPNGRIYLKESANFSQIIDLKYSEKNLKLVSKSHSLEFWSPDCIAWFSLENSHATSRAIEEARTLIRLWPNSILTGSIHQPNGNRIEPGENEVVTTQLMRPHYALKSLCRRTVKNFLPVNFLVPIQILLEINWETDWDLTRTIGEIYKYLTIHKVRVITSPELHLDGVTSADINFVLKLHDLAKVISEDFNVFEICNNQEKFSLDLPSRLIYGNMEVQRNITMEVVTTLRGESSHELLETLFNSLKDQFLPGVTWRLLVHGNISEELKNLLVKFESYSEIFVHHNLKSLDLATALKEITSYTNAEWIFLADYDDEILPFTLSVLINVISNSDADVYLGNELTGSSLENSLYYKRPVPNFLSVKLFSQFFHPIVCRPSRITKILNGDSNYLVDWQIVSSVSESEKIVFIDLPLYFWRSHIQSTTNNNEGSLQSKHAVKKRLLEFKESFSDSSSVRIKENDGDFYLKKNGGELPSICLQIIGSGSIYEKSQTLSKFRDKYIFTHWNFVDQVSVCKCGSDLILGLPIGVYPSSNFNLLQATIFHSSSWIVSTGLITDPRNVTSNLNGLNTDFRIFRNYTESMPFEDYFRKVDHYPSVKMNSLSPLLVRNIEVNNSQIFESSLVLDLNLNVVSEQ